MTTIDTATVIRSLRFDASPETAPLPDYQPAGSYDRLDIDIDPALPDAIRLHIARQCSPAWQQLRPHRLFIVDGPGGTGKTTAVRCVASRSGVDVTLVPGGTIGGETENAGVVVLKNLLEGCSRVALATGRPHLLVVDDADLSIFVTREHREYTVDTDNTTGLLQHVCDDRSRFVDAAGRPIGFLFTGNDFRGLRQTLQQRATLFTYTPTWRQAAAQVERIARPRSARSRRALYRLVRRHRSQPVRFFVEVLAAAADAAVAPLLAASPLDIAAIDQAVVAMREAELDVAALLRIADRHAAATPVSHIIPWR